MNENPHAGYDGTIYKEWHDAKAEAWDGGYIVGWNAAIDKVLEEAQLDDAKKKLLELLFRKQGIP